MSARTADDMARDLATRDVHYFDAACALYWYASDYHGGQSSELYSILSTLGYHPGAGERGPEPDSVDADLYAELENGTLDPALLRAWIDAQSAADDA